MSQINVNQMVDSQGGVLAPISSVMRNRIINGSQTIDQRNAGAAVTVDNAPVYVTDRFQVQDFSDAVLSAQQITDAPAGFTNSLRVTVSTADTSLAATQGDRVNQRIEGFNIADLGWGTASALPVTLSFWVKSSLTGSFGGSLQNSASNRGYPYSYTINAANTWEYKTVTIAGDTTGTWLTNNGMGILVNWSLGMGSTYSGTAGAWAAADLISTTGAVSLVGTASATWQVTGVQLEKGTQATSFEYRQYGQELALCQRYYGKFVGTGSATGASFGTGIANNASQAAITIQFPQTMRAAPTLSQSQLAASDATNYDSNVTSIAGQNSGTTHCRFVVATAGGMTGLRTTILVPQGSTSGYIEFSAEL